MSRTFIGGVECVPLHAVVVPNLAPDDSGELAEALWSLADALSTVVPTVLVPKQCAPEVLVETINHVLINLSYAEEQMWRDRHSAALARLQLLADVALEG